MIGTLAQLVSLTSYGNQCICSGEFPLYYYPQNSTFQFCNTVDFRQLNNGQESVLCPNPNSFFGYLKLSACKKVRLYYQPASPREGAMEHQLAGMVGGGGTWMLETIYTGYSNYWSNRWQVTKKEDPDNKIWSVNYLLTHPNKPTNNLQPNVIITMADLGAALQAITVFAKQQNLSNWAEIFDRALARLNSNSPETDYYHQDLIVTVNYPLPARQLLFAAGSAWVFGGMGSWNDLGFNTPEEQKAYIHLSASLYDTINRSIVAAINSFPV